MIGTSKEYDEKVRKMVKTPMKNTQTWDERFMDIAERASTWSKHPVHRVGAVIVDNMHRIIAQGYNGLPHGADDTKIAERHTIHAEVNAILVASRNGCGISVCTLYCTHPPCSRCCSVIAQAGYIDRVVSLPGTAEFLSRWGEDCKKGREILEETGVNYVELFRI
jgi:dCMP deaminase